MGTFYGQANGETITGTAAADEIYANGYDNTVKAGEGDDYIEGGYGSPYGSHELLYGEGGNDFIVITPADGHRTDPWSLADGGSGTDTAYVDFSNFGSGLTYVHNNTSADIHCGRLAGRLVSIEKIVFQGGFANDQITGGTGDDAIFGNAGDDRIAGGDGNDVLSGGSGTDNVAGGAGNDGIQFDQSGNDTLDGGAGNDTLDFYVRWNGAGVTLDLRSASKVTIGGRSITLSGFENLVGTTYADKLTLGSAAGFIGGLDGNDTLAGSKLNDVLNGGAGNDSLNGNAGADTLIGGAGNDTYYVDNVGDKVIETKSASDLTDAGGVDTVRSSIAFSLAANSGVQVVENLVLQGSGDIAGTGNDLANRLTGNAGANVLEGGGGADRILGLGGADTLRGGAGNDVLQGGIGRDTMSGGAGADRFVFDDGDFVSGTADGSERIGDFSHAEHDRIDLKLVDAKAGGADDPFTFIGAAAFSHTAGELRAFASGADTVVQGDTNGDGVADFWIALTGAPTLVQGDFVL